VKKIPPAERKERALGFLRMVRLPEDYYRKNVMKCSGGERQRVALARAFAYDPEVLLFDEPLSALDYKLKKILEKELKDLHRETGKTFIYITHSLEEAMVMSDRIAVMRAGKIIQAGPPEEIYARPADRFVAEFFGEVNVFKAKLGVENQWFCEDCGLKLNMLIPPKLASADHLSLVVRPETMRFVPGRDGADNVLEGEVYNEYSLGSRVQYQIRSGNRTLLVEVSSADSMAAGYRGKVLVGWNADAAIVTGT
jgi:spermidine/putrescine transport system ATP-binding protein